VGGECRLREPFGHGLATSRNVWISGAAAPLVVVGVLVAKL
jgi:hypothetical protein